VIGDLGKLIVLFEYKIPAHTCWDFVFYVVGLFRIAGTNEIRRSGSGSKNFLVMIKEILI
jgi:hypothetical protein